MGNRTMVEIWVYGDDNRSLLNRGTFAAAIVISNQKILIRFQKSESA
jgi:hypothetical protein